MRFGSALLLLTLVYALASLNFSGRYFSDWEFGFVVSAATTYLAAAICWLRHKLEHRPLPQGWRLLTVAGFSCLLSFIAADLADQWKSALFAHTSCCIIDPLPPLLVPGTPFTASEIVYGSLFFVLTIGVAWMIRSGQQPDEVAL